ncbi:hypothetical protein N9R95_01445 [Flavobacteriaceae bacterium]|nr:hypothetical protein [Flavobacteriaceae bacterium]
MDTVSLALVLTYADEIKSDSKYRSSASWRYLNLSLGMTCCIRKELQR